MVLIQSVSLQVVFQGAPANPGDTAIFHHLNHPILATTINLLFSNLRAVGGGLRMEVYGCAEDNGKINNPNELLFA